MRGMGGSHRVVLYHSVRRVVGHVALRGLALSQGHLLSRFWCLLLLLLLQIVLANLLLAVVHSVDGAAHSQNYSYSHNGQDDEEEIKVTNYGDKKAGSGCADCGGPAPVAELPSHQPWVSPGHQTFFCITDQEFHELRWFQVQAPCSDLISSWGGGGAVYSTQPGPNLGLGVLGSAQHDRGLLSIWRGCTAPNMTPVLVWGVVQCLSEPQCQIMVVWPVSSMTGSYPWSRWVAQLLVQP